MAHLYIMSRSDAPGILKIGRSDDPESRAKTLQSCQCFWVNVLAVFKHGGALEADVHYILQHVRIDGPGREWYRVDFSDALTAIAKATRPSETMEDTDMPDEPEQRDLKIVALEFADTYLKEWDRSMGRPSSRKQINEQFALLPNTQSSLQMKF